MKHTHRLNAPKNAHQRELLAEYDRRRKQFAFTAKNHNKAVHLLQSTIKAMEAEGMLVKLEEAPIETTTKTVAEQL